MADIFNTFSSEPAGAGMSSSVQAPQLTWQDLLKMFSGSSGISPTGLNSGQQRAFMWPGMQQQNKQVAPAVPLYNQLQPMLPEEDQQKQSSIDDIAKYIKFFQGLF